MKTHECANPTMRMRLTAWLASTALVLNPLTGIAADNLPTGGQPVSGSVAIAISGTTTTITQRSDKAIVNWSGFSISAGNAVNLVQPGSSSAILNRVTVSTAQWSHE